MTYLQLSHIYGYDPATVSRDWKARGLDISQTDEEIYQWVQDNVLTPDQLRRNLIEVDYVTESLSSYLLQLKNMLRSIPNTTYVELFSSEDANQLRETLKDKIDEVLRDIGNYEYEEEIEEYENGISESEEIIEDIESGSEEHPTASEDKTE